MNERIVLKQTQSAFLFTNDGSFHAFNLIRLMESILHNEELIIDICNLSNKQQSSVVSKIATVLKLMRRLSGNKNGLVLLIFSRVDPMCVQKSLESTGGMQDDKTLIFDLPKLTTSTDVTRDPHYVKNVRGAVLLSLAAELIENGNLSSSTTFFNKPYPICLHSAATFLHNDENAYLMWKVLKNWESTHDNKYNIEVNRLIKFCGEAIATAKEISGGLTLTNSNVRHVADHLQVKCDLPENIYAFKEHPLAWLIDDQFANGWGELFSHLLYKIDVELECFSSLEDMLQSVKAMEVSSLGCPPDIAFVDLRLSSEDPTVESYDSEDLSGFAVVDSLLGYWPGLPVVIASASNKLWNVEKAIKKGATGYWRKSDEDLSGVDDEAVFTALLIYKQFIEKTITALRKARFRHVFRIAESLKKLSFCSPICNTSLQRSVVRYCNDAPRKVSIMLWQELDQTETINSLFLGVMELFNEVEPLLWNHDNDELICKPGTRIQERPEKKDKLIINDTLEHLNVKYQLTGISLERHFTDIKGVRNNLPFVHGSQATNTAENANIIDIELALLLVWVLSQELISLN